MLVATGDGSIADDDGTDGVSLDGLLSSDRKEARMVPNALSIVSKPSLKDWYYNRGLTAQTAAVFLQRFFTNPERMDDFQMHSAEDGYVSTPEDGVLAGMTEDGRMSSFFYPHTGFTQQMPYFVQGEQELQGLEWKDGPLFLKRPGLRYEESDIGGSKPREGGFLGVGDDPDWLWELEMDREMRYRDGTGILDMRHENEDLLVEESFYVVPGTETVSRDFRVVNRSDEPIESLTYYMQANANDNMQYTFWNSNRNRATADDEITWRDIDTGLLGNLLGRERDDGYEIQLFTDADVVGSGVAETELDELFREAEDRVEGEYIGGYLELDVDIPPGEEATFSVFVGGDESATDAEILDASGEERQRRVEDRWEEYTADVDLSHVGTEHRDQYERSLNALMKLVDPESGSISAAPNLQPTYYPSWVRDAAFSAVALAKAGKGDLAKKFLGEFCPSVQEEDGSFKQCYASNGEYAGIIDIENDQQPAFAWAVREVYEETGDDAFLEQVWPAVQDALDYTVDRIVAEGTFTTDREVPGLLESSHDFAEMLQDSRQSLWSNAFAYRGLHDGAYLAEQLDADGEGYRAAAERLGETVHDRFVADKEEHPPFYADAMERAHGLLDDVEDVPGLGRVARCMESRLEHYEEDFFTHFDDSGSYTDRNTAFAAAVYPSGWAADHDVEDAMLDSFEEYFEGYDTFWLPREFILAGSLYRHGREEAGDRVVARMTEETTPSGTLAEQVEDDGTHTFASLGWSQAGYILAMEEKYGAD